MTIINVKEKNGNEKEVNGKKVSTVYYRSFQNSVIGDPYSSGKWNCEVYFVTLVLSTT